MENVKKLGGQQFLKKLNFETIPNFGARQNLETKSDTRPDIKYGNLLGEVRRSNNLSSGINAMSGIFKCFCCISLWNKDNDVNNGQLSISINYRSD